MLSEVNASPKAKAFWGYAIISGLLALSPIWTAYLIINSYPSGDSMGSGGDVFVWFYYVTLAFVAYLVVQLLSFFGRSLIPRRTHKMVILGTLVAWMVSLIAVAAIR